MTESKQDEMATMEESKQDEMATMEESKPDKMGTFMKSESEGIIAMELHDYSFYSRTFFQRVNENSPVRPYLTFKTKPGRPQRLIVRIWSHDQGWCNPDLEDNNDEYANSWTWFAFGSVPEADPEEGEIPCQTLHDFQRNPRARSEEVCHVNEWKIGVPVKAEDKDDSRPLDNFLDSLAAPGTSREIGIFPMARYPYWENHVWKVEVEVRDWYYERTIKQDSRHIITTRPVNPDETSRLSKLLKLRVQKPTDATPKQLIDYMNENRRDNSVGATNRVRYIVNSLPFDHPVRPVYLGHLAMRLSERYHRMGVEEDLRLSISLYRQAVADIHLSERDRSIILLSLGNALCDRFRLSHAMRDLEEAVNLIRSVIAEAPPDDSPGLPERLISLATVLQEHYHYPNLGTIGDLEEAITVGREAIAAIAPDNPNFSYILGVLGSCLFDYYNYNQEPKHLDEAISLCRQAISTPSVKGQRSRWLTDLGGYLDEGYRRTQVQEYQDLATEYFLLSLRSEGGLGGRIRAGSKLLSRPNILQLGPQTYKDAAIAAGLVPKLFKHSSSIADNRNILSAAVGIASNAAAIALHFHQGPGAAIQLLETGRGVLINQTSNLRADLSELRSQRPELAHSFDGLKNNLDVPRSNHVVAADDSPSLFSDMDQRHTDAGQMLRLLREIRKEDRFTRFLEPATDDDMRRAAFLGPIVILNASIHRCDAIIVQESGIRALELPDLTLAAIQQQTDHIQSMRTLEWLWDSVVEPVLDALGIVRPPLEGYWPHVWWIPTGPLTRFPIHAAGYHLESGGKRTAIDRVISSYSSSINTIIRTRQRRIRKVNEQNSSVVVTSMQSTPGLGFLANTDNEISAVREQCMLEPLGLPVVSPKPYRDDVMAALPACRIFHFAGHGQAAEDPLQSFLCLEDWNKRPLTVTGLIETDLGHAGFPFLAYLSACSTGRNLDPNIADESLHLTSMFHLTGFRHVIGTLWEVDDSLCVDMARMVYESLGVNGLNDASVSIALHHAIRAARRNWLMEEVVARARNREADGMKSGEEILAEVEAGIRDVKLCSDEVYKAPLWVPYIHFGA
ncbi:hypothetical protein CP533_1569 [Ophiocordyceps camponoti-saundersi (nom. inval.)]|nr:hypothetical protein CP533_1569 [Ophiocordyceps camponoti-saundersi (nom. inval.)]